MGAARDFDAARAPAAVASGSHDRLHHERGGARRRDLEAEVARASGPGLEAQVGRAVEGAADLGLADERGRAHGGEVLRAAGRDATRRARIFVISKPWPVTAERASAVRRTCPPPSPCAPSIGIRRAMTAARRTAAPRARRAQPRTKSASSVRRPGLGGNEVARSRFQALGRSAVGRGRAARPWRLGIGLGGEEALDREPTMPCGPGFSNRTRSTGCSASGVEVRVPGAASPAPRPRPPRRSPSRACRVSMK